MTTTRSRTDLAIECTDLTKRFGNFTAVDTLSFDVPERSIFGFLGPNGSGKSTTIRMLCGILRPTSGCARVNGLDVAQDPEGVRRALGYMSQRFSLYDDLTSTENLQFFAGVYGLHGGARGKRIREVLELTDMVADAGMLVAHLSVGVRQRLALGAALLHKPPILFLDEPTSGVDPVSRRRFWHLIHSLTEQGTTVLVTTHYMDEAEHCHDIVMIRSGRLVARGSPEALKQTTIAGSIVGVDCTSPTEGADVLSGLAYVRQATLHGTRIHAVVLDADSAERDIRRDLQGKGIQTRSVYPVRATLEDVFVSLAEGLDEA